ncbi:hypothetical protein TNCT_125571 [Trichonephila clavata]|uniref:Uncharacterized protein n=1 Tax=Trichonephila clavata TaxID=2740835 RepID=A0A8X6LUK3_TRICU|nr:hypothetical protein TNCT_125571 [Trichonephila clavata]
MVEAKKCLPDVDVGARWLERLGISGSEIYLIPSAKTAYLNILNGTCALQILAALLRKPYGYLIISVCDHRFDIPHGLFFYVFLHIVLISYYAAFGLPLVVLTHRTLECSK